ncbi:hypothetical protein Ccrd_019950 [Cynara cardunculus var. scolymus]|uniref:DUF7036 domain-containing protein n=1 Tax=Cynara cardunculus var. scolymus TaxID=59895 RepID=A0A103Y3A9_CYNCS|nr:hypothetical protein Ccrd_019950 [Cynara cardunculus var. scolymus]
MGKSKPELPINHNHNHNQQQNRHRPSFFVRCSRGFSRFGQLFSFKCVFILLLSVSVSLSAIFSVFHFQHRQSGFDAKDSIKNSAGASNWTDVVFGILSKPVNSPINSVSLILLRSSLVDLFTQCSNLTLTTSVFGMPSSIEILKFPGGITIIPKLSLSGGMLPQVLFNFTLRNSLHDIEENYLQLKEQLESGLQLMPYESVFVQVTNKDGSTQNPPVTVQASVLSNLGSLEPPRLKQLAEEITRSPPAKNLGLDNTVFGKVKEISLSSYLFHTLDAPTPSPSPMPSPDQNDHVGSTIIPSPATSPSPNSLHLPPCTNCVASSPSPQNEPNQSLPPVSNPPAPAMDPYCGGSDLSPSSGPAPGPDPSYHPLPPPPTPTPTSPLPMYPRSRMAPNLSPLPAVSYGSLPQPENRKQKGLAPSPLAVLPSSSSAASGVLRPLLVLILMALHILLL